MSQPLAAPFDALILGAGPAGLAAAIYLGRYLRPTLVLNEKEPSTRWHRPTAHNVLGFPAGIMRSQLLEWGRDHAAKYDHVQFHQTTITEIAPPAADSPFFALTDALGQTYRGRGLILATGVEYQLPLIAGPTADVLPYAGISLFHCPECDGYKVRRQKIVVLGRGPGSAEMALQLTVWTPSITLCTNGQDPALTPEAAAKLDARGIPIVRTAITSLLGDPTEGRLRALRLEDHREIPCTAVFANEPCDPPTDLYAQLGLRLHKSRWVLTDYRQRTNLPRCYAAGDIVAFAQTQLSVAMGQGATAAIYLHKELLPDELKLTS